MQLFYFDFFYIVKNRQKLFHEKFFVEHVCKYYQNKERKIMKERTFIILKPDCMEKNLLPEVMGRFLNAGLTLVACKMSALSEDILAKHYAHIVDKPYYPPLVKFMTRRPVVMAILEGDNAVSRVRKLLGCTNSLEAPAGTIRGDFGLDTRENIAHASDSPENAQIEINRFFATDEIFDV